MMGRFIMNFLKLKIISIDKKYLGALSFTTLFLFFTLPFLFDWLKIRGFFDSLIVLALLVFSAACSLNGILNAKGISLVFSWISFLFFIFFCWLQLEDSISLTQGTQLELRIPCFIQGIFNSACKSRDYTPFCYRHFSKTRG